MDPFQASSDPHRDNGVAVVEDWAFSESDDTLKPILSRFSGNMKATINHLATIHNETCGCQMGSTSQEVVNKAWNQKKVPFMELQKQSGLDFEDYLNRVLRLLLTNSIRNIPPVSESEFWMTLRQGFFNFLIKLPFKTHKKRKKFPNNIILRKENPQILPRNLTFSINLKINQPYKNKRVITPS